MIWCRVRDLTKSSRIFFAFARLLESSCEKKRMSVLSNFFLCTLSSGTGANPPLPHPVFSFSSFYWSFPLAHFSVVDTWFLEVLTLSGIFKDTNEHLKSYAIVFGSFLFSCFVVQLLCHKGILAQRSQSFVDLLFYPKSLPRSKYFGLS